MDHIIVKNLGPIRHAELDLNKVNVFMGPQSCGKSTLVKAICHCRWVEKRATMDKSLNEFNHGEKFLRNFMRFHKLSAEYFSDETYIHYSGTSIEMTLSGRHGILQIHWKTNAETNYLNNKLIYIPAERNFVAAVPNLTKYAERKDNLLNFIYDWYDIKKYYTDSSRLGILNLGANFSHSDTHESGMIRLENGIGLPLSSASSGLQSVTPLIMLFEYLSSGIYADKRPISYEEREQLLRYAEQLIALGGKDEDDYDYESNLGHKILNRLKQSEYKYTQFFIEEPEQNLFPATQKELIYHLLQGCLYDPNRDHQLYLTTHSPFILYALNNCMMGYLASQNSDEPSLQNTPSKNAWIAASRVSIWQIENGELHAIQDEDGLIKDNYFDQVMKSVMDEFYEFLPYAQTESQPS